MTLKVRGERIFVRPDEQPAMSEGGLHLVYDRQRSTMRGTVLALGDGPVTAKGVRLPHLVKVGDAVIFSPDVGEELSFEKDIIISMRETDVLAVVEGA